MAYELGAYYSTPALSTVYGLLRQGTKFVKASDGSLVNFNATNRPNAAIYFSDAVVSGIGEARFYRGSVPVGTADGLYELTVWKRAGSVGSEAGTDELIGSPTAVDWDGSAIREARYSLLGSLTITDS